MLCRLLRPYSHKRLWPNLSVLLLLFSFTTQACEVIDDTGQTIKLAHPARRIISLAPDLTELLFAAGAGNQIVGVMQGSDYPVAAKKIPIVANYNSIDSEKILSLRPDLIIVWMEGNLARSMKKWGIPIYYSHQKKMTDIPKTLQRFGCLAGTEKKAADSVHSFTERYQALQKAYSYKKQVSVFYQVWPQPLMTITKNSWINDAIMLCGGKNIFADLHGVAPEVNIESVITANPDVIIGVRSKQNWQKIWHSWSQMIAVQKNHVFTLSPDLIERADMRVLDGAEEMCQAFEVARRK
jgi:iron complex transport system substrate-binding protein